MQLRETGERKRTNIYDPSTEQPQAARKLQRKSSVEEKSAVDETWVVSKDSYIVKAIIDHRRVANARNYLGLAKFEFRIRWEGYSTDADSWVPYFNDQH